VRRLALLRRLSTLFDLAAHFGSGDISDAVIALRLVLRLEERRACRSESRR
jgi:hypothetical protein